MAGEPETLDSDEPLARRIERHDYDRLLMLSDGVFAIAITLLVLELRPPEVWNGGFAELLRGTWRALFGYVFGFIAVGGFWAARRALFARLRRIDGPAPGLSLLLLLLVAMVPAVAALVAEHGPGKSMPAYLALVTAIGAAQASLWVYAAFVAHLVDPVVTLRERRARLARLLIPPVLFGLLLVLQMSGLGKLGALPIILVAVVAGTLRRRLARARDA